MIVDALKEYIKAIEQDCDKLISEGNTVIKAEGVSWAKREQNTQIRSRTGKK